MIRIEEVLKLIQKQTGGFLFNSAFVKFNVSKTYHYPFHFKYSGALTMNLQKRLLSFLLLSATGLIHVMAGYVDTVSVYRFSLDDPEAFYFTPGNSGIRADGIMDVSDALQSAIC